MNLYIINESGSPPFHRQLWVNGRVHRCIPGLFCEGGMETLDLAIRNTWKYPEEFEDRDRNGDWDQKLKWSSVL